MHVGTDRLDSVGFVVAEWLKYHREKIRAEAGTVAGFNSNDDC